MLEYVLKIILTHSAAGMWPGEGIDWALHSQLGGITGCRSNSHFSKAETGEETK